MLEEVGSRAHPCGGRADCVGKGFSWGAVKNDQAVTSGQEAFCSVCKGEAITITKVTASIPPIVPLPQFGRWLDWKALDDVESINNHGMHGL